MLFRGIKHQVDKGPVDSVTGKAKYTLNDNRLLREDVEYRPLVREGVLVCGGRDPSPGGVPASRVYAWRERQLILWLPTGESS